MDSKPFWMSKTMWVNIIAGAITGVEIAGVTDLLTASQQSGLAVAVIAANIVLRWITTSPVTLR